MPISNLTFLINLRSLPPLPRKTHRRKNGKHHLPTVLLNHLYPIFPLVPFVGIVWQQGQKASRQIANNLGESKTRCGDSFCIDIISIRANLTNFVICFILFSTKIEKVKKCNMFTFVPETLSPRPPGTLPPSKIPFVRFQWCQNHPFSAKWRPSYAYLKFRI